MNDPDGDILEEAVAEIIQNDFDAGLASLVEGTTLLEEAMDQANLKEVGLGLSTAELAACVRVQQTMAAVVGSFLPQFIPDHPANFPEPKETSTSDTPPAT